MKKINPIVVAVVIVILMITVTVVLTGEQTHLVEEPYELPYRYEVYNFRVAGEGIEGVRLSTSFLDGNIFIGGKEMKIENFYPSSKNLNFDLFLRDEDKSRWQFFTFGEDKVGVVWESDEISIGESVILPTGEKLILNEIDPCTGDPQFSVIVE